jgi:pimeloyl-ACP methyl ester carboxylesterase
MTRWLVLAVSLALVACAGMETVPEAPPANDLRGVYRAALCSRLSEDDCASTLRGLDGVAAAPAPPPAEGSLYRLLFVPGFMASCFRGIHSFADVIVAAREQGYAADVLAVGGRNGVPANAKLIAEQIERLPDDGRRIILIGHSKGADDVLQMIVDRPDLASKVVAVLSVAGALNGSPHADELRGLYMATLATYPFFACGEGDGDPVGDLAPEARRSWWTQYGASLRVPVFSLVALPDLTRLSPALLLAYLSLSRVSSDNDGMLIAHNELAPRGYLLAYLNADHLSIAIPPPDTLMALLFSHAAIPRPQAFLAAFDVITQHVK